MKVKGRREGVGGQPTAPCWAPETGRSPQSSGLVGGVLPSDTCPSPGRHQRGQEGFVTSYSHASQDTV